MAGCGLPDNSFSTELRPTHVSNEGNFNCCWFWGLSPDDTLMSSESRCDPFQSISTFN